MNLAETAKLIIQLDLKGNAQAGIAKVRGELGKLDSTVHGRLSSGFKTLGTGLGVAFVRAGILAVGAIGGIVTAVGVMVKEGQAAQKVQLVFNQAVKNSGKVSTDYVKILNDQSLALMNLSGMDDEAVKSAQTMLIQMDLTGKQVAEVTPLVLDFAQATGLDLETAAKLTGKSINGMAGALSRYGVFVDKAKFKTDPYVATMEALNQKFGGTTKALSGTLTARLGALREGLANIREEAGIKLLPALTHLIDVAGKKLVPAFAKFIDRILPALIKGINDLADIVESGGVERGINLITDSIGPMVKVLQMAVAPVKAIVSSFLRLPQKVQAALISGVILNKLSGGLVAKGGGDIVGAAGSLAGPALGTLVGTVLGKLGFTRGGSPASPLFVMDVQNRLPTGQFAPGFTKQTTLLGKIASVAGKVFIIGAAVGVFAELKGILDEQSAQNKATTDAQVNQLSDFIKQASPADLKKSLNDLVAIDKNLSNSFSPEAIAYKLNIDGVRDTLHADMIRLQAAILSLPGAFANSLPSAYLLAHLGDRTPAPGDKTPKPKPKPKGSPFLPGDSRSERSYASGEYDVPFDMPANVHKGEMIVPSRLAKLFRLGVSQVGVHGGPKPMFVPTVKLDTSQITDRRFSPIQAIQNQREWDGLQRAAARRLAMVHFTQRAREWGGRFDAPSLHTATHRTPRDPYAEIGRPYGQNVSVKVTTSTRDQTTAAIVRNRWGPTPAQAGAT